MFIPATNRHFFDDDASWAELREDEEIIVISEEDHEEEYPEYDGWYEEEPAQHGFCDSYGVHEAHHYWALNGNLYSCSGFSQADLEALEAEARRPPCEHGMSASLCSGPNHW